MSGMAEPAGTPACSVKIIDNLELRLNYFGKDSLRYIETFASIMPSHFAGKALPAILFLCHFLKNHICGIINGNGQLLPVEAQHDQKRIAVLCRL